MSAGNEAGRAEVKKRKASPLNKIVAAVAVTAAVIYGITRIDGCSKSEDTENVSETTTSSTSSTTTTTQAPKPWWEDYGWDYDYSYQTSRSNLNEGLANRSPFKIAYGRCIITDFSDTDYTRVIANPTIFEGKYRNVGFTTFSGVSVLKPKNSSNIAFSKESATFIDGSLYFGSFGVIPNSSKMTDGNDSIDVYSAVQRKELKGEVFPAGADYVTLANASEYQQIGPASVYYFEEGRPDYVGQVCVSSAAYIEEPNNAR